MARYRLILVGIGIQSMMIAIETFLVRRFPIDDVIWADNLLLGSVGGAAWPDVRMVAIGLALLLPLALFMAWPLRALQLGDDTARTVGWPVEFVRFLLMFVSCWLAALAISVAGWSTNSTGPRAVPSSWCCTTSTSPPATPTTSSR